LIGAGCDQPGPLAQPFEEKRRPSGVVFFVPKASVFSAPARRPRSRQGLATPSKIPYDSSLDAPGPFFTLANSLFLIERRFPFGVSMSSDSRGTPGKAFDAIAATLHEGSNPPEKAPQVLHENRLFRVLSDGGEPYLDPIPYSEGVLIIPRFANGDFLVTRIQRAPNLGLSVEFPRGGLDFGESGAEGATRELREETGYALPARSARALGRIAPSPQLINCKVEVFVIDIPDGAAQSAFDANEIHSLARLPECQFAAMAHEGQIFDGMTLAAYALLALAA